MLIVCLLILSLHHRPTLLRSAYINHIIVGNPFHFLYLIVGVGD